MRCPLCGVPLELVQRQGVDIDRCPSCRGVWLDRGELDKIVERNLAGDPRRDGFSLESTHPTGHDTHPPANRRRKSSWADFFDFD